MRYESSPMKRMRAHAVVLAALVGCGGEKAAEPTEVQVPEPAPSETAEKKSKAIPPSTAPAPAPASSGPRYVRRMGSALVDATGAPSVPAFMVENDIKYISSKYGAAALLKRFGLTALAGKTGQVWMAKASLVDDTDRERLLFATFRSDTSAEGIRNEDAIIAFLGTTTKDNRVFGLGNAKISAKTRDGDPLEVTARRLHSASLDDVVVTFATCETPAAKGCHVLRAWTMERGHPELIADVSADAVPQLVGSAPPYDIVAGERVLRFDRDSFGYK